MDYQRFKELDILLGAFEIKVRRQFRTFLKLMDILEISREEYDAYIDECIRQYRQDTEKWGDAKREKRNREIEHRKQLLTALLPKCPICGEILNFQELSCTQKKRTKKPGLWFCKRGWNSEDPKEWCGFEQFSQFDNEDITGFIVLEKPIPLE